MPLQKIAPAHIAHGSALVYSVEVASTSGVKSRTARCSRFISACARICSSVIWLFSATASTAPLPATSIAPNGRFPCARARRAIANTSRMCASWIDKSRANELSLSDWSRRPSARS